MSRAERRNSRPSIRRLAVYPVPATTEVKPNPKPLDLDLTAELVVHLPEPNCPFLLLPLTVDDKVSYVSGSLSRGHITPPLTET